MNKNTFERVVEDTLGMVQKVLTRKSGEYSSSDDKLHNFDKAKDLMRCKTKEFALLGMLNKHLVSVIDMIEKFEKTGELPTSNMIDEKIGDSINYFILLKACFYDDMIKKEAEKICKCDCEREKEKDDKIKDCPERAMSLTEIFKQNEGAIANSIYQNPRKRLVVEKLRKMLKSLFVWLTDNNRFVDYEKIKDILNKAELERDHVPDEFIKDVVVEIEQLDISSVEWYRLRDQVITEVIQVMLQPKYKIGDKIWIIGLDLADNKWKVVYGMIIEKYALYVEDKALCYKSMFGEMSHEKYCFKTKEEAQRECDNRNNTNAAK